MSHRQICAACEPYRKQFSAYLDGELSGVEMGALGAHLDSCAGCSTEFAAWRETQRTLGAMRRTALPPELAAQIGTALAAEATRGSHRSFFERATAAWRATLEPWMVRVGAASMAAMALLTAVSMIPGAPVQANDDAHGAMTAPRYLYSQAAEMPVASSISAPLLIEATVDSDGKVFDYRVLSGKVDAATLRRIETNLVFSVFQPATVFGEPATGRVVLTYTGITVHS